MQNKKKVYLHKSPDADAICAAWLLIRLSKVTDFELGFVSQTETEIPLDAWAVVDVLGRHDPLNFLFDHHQDPSLGSAIKLVYNHFFRKRAKDLGLVWPIVELVDEADRGLNTDAVKDSRFSGLHALISQLKRERLSDDELVRQIFAVLDEVTTVYSKRLLRTFHREDRQIYTLYGVWRYCLQTVFDKPEYVSLIQKHQEVIKGYEERLKQAIFWHSPDEKVIALNGAGTSVTHFAFEQKGVELVLFYDDRGGSQAIGIQRANRLPQIFCGKLVDRVLEKLQKQEGKKAAEIAAELSTWHKDKRGYWSGRGTPTAPDSRPVDIDLDKLAELFYHEYKRYGSR